MAIVSDYALAIKRRIIVRPRARGEVVESRLNPDGMTTPPPALNDGLTGSTQDGTHNRGPTARLSIDGYRSRASPGTKRPQRT